MATNILTKELIRNNFQRLKHNTTLPDVSVAFIQFLLLPYENVLQPINDIKNIREWVNFTFPYQISELFNREITIRIDVDRYLSVETTKEIVLAELTFLILQNADDAIEVRNGSDSVTILPWDIRDGIINEDLLQMFNFDPVDDKLPVTFIVQGIHHTHMCSFDFTMGLLTFCKASGVDFQPHMWGQPLGNDNNQYRYIEIFLSQYSVEIINDTDAYDFNGIDFMWGFSTGAFWAGVNHRNYWTNLRQYSEDENEDDEGTLITF